ncbi:MAG TPA: hypothetical protein VHE80_03550 [Acidimicrobiales bacterium]|nr:hypothetical protein [Acidimicrobiales bacterium]
MLGLDLLPLRLEPLLERHLEGPPGSPGERPRPLDVGGALPDRLGGVQPVQGCQTQANGGCR